ncbi:MAG: shikimate kinase [Eubacterium sp.]|nr:shikimate kinase [Eubacterium sp.]
MSRKFGLIGAKLNYTYSPLIHKEFGDYQYDICETKADELAGLLASPEYDGFNVTIPYKKTVMKLCDIVSDEAKKIGAVNAVVRTEDGLLSGFNTDYFGFKYQLEHHDIDVEDRKCVVLGDGGASVTIQAVLNDLHAREVVVISRKGENNYDNISRHFDAEILVNATPVGMYPDNGSCLVNVSDFTSLEGVVDVIYNPYRTKLILDAIENGIPCTGGLEMLVAQAKQTSEIFTGNLIDDDEIETVIDEVQRRVLNNVLIGMPGSGKTFLGKKMAEKQGKRFIDIDDMVIQHEGSSIEDIFREKGEAYFRKVETEMLKLACKENGCVIATGGGIIKTKANYNIVKQNGVVIWIKRDLDKLETDGRPLSTSTGVEQLYKERKDEYKRWSDYYIDNNQEL